MIVQIDAPALMNNQFDNLIISSGLLSQPEFKLTYPTKNENPERTTLGIMNKLQNKAIIQHERLSM